MTDSSRPGETSSARRRRGWLKRCVFFLLWLSAVVFCFALVSGLVVWWLVSHPTDATRVGIDLFASGSGIQVEAVEWGEQNTLQLRGVNLDVDGRQGVRLETVDIGYSGLGLGLLKEGRIRSLSVRGGSARIDQALLARLGAGGAGKAKKRPEKPPGKSGHWLERTLPDQVAIEDLALAIDLAGVPPLAAKVDFQSAAFADLIGGVSNETAKSRERLVLRDGAWLASPNEQPVAFTEIGVDFTIGEAFRRIVIHDSQVSGLRVDLTRELLAEYFATESETRGGEPPEVVVEQFQAEGVELVFGGERLPALKTGFDLELVDLRLAGGELSSAAEQKLVFRATEMRAPGGSGDIPLLGAERTELHVVPDDFFARGEIERLRCLGLDVVVSQASLGDLLDLASDTVDEAPPGDDGSSADRPGIPEALRYPLVREFRIEGASLDFDPAGLFDGVPAGRAKLELRSTGAAADGDFGYGLELSELEVREHAGAERPFATGAQIVASFRGLGLQRDGIIDDVAITGVHGRIGDEVSRLAEIASAAAAARSEDDPQTTDGATASGDTEAPVADGGQSLGIAKLRLSDSTLTLRNLIPGALPSLTIGIDTQLEDVPLLGRSRADEREQRIELKGVQLASPYNPLQNVAELKTVWVYFSIPGLFRNELKRVEIVSPDLYVGEPLFWYIDYARRFAQNGGSDAAEAAAGPPGEPGESGESGEGAGDAIVEGLQSFELSGWRVAEIAAHSGRIIVAPTGVPLGIVPFPFNVKTDFTKGEIALDVEVPSGDYTFEQLELELLRLAGKAYVNYPIATENNNFVQTFESPEVKFRQFRGEEVWLSVTYNQEGIYGQLGGEAYGGYVKGGFNIYVDGPFRWDAWVSGTGLDLGDFTQVLAPDSFLMGGKIDGQVIAEGREFELHKATGEIRAPDGGRMHVLSLDKVKAALPEDWDPVWRALTEAGIDTLRDYRFEAGEAEVRYEGGEGDARVLLDGEDGKRDLRFRLFDRRGEKAGGTG